MASGPASERGDEPGRGDDAGGDAPSPPHAALDEATLAAFLDAFYARVRRDPLLGPVFSARIADDDWPRHLATIRDFWSSVLLKSGRYKGNPFGKHLGVTGIAPEHFARWLGLFRQTADERFVPEIAAALRERADRIGDSLKAGLFFRPGAAPLPAVAEAGPTPKMRQDPGSEAQPETVTSRTNPPS